MVIISEEKCINCGMCVTDCFFQNLIMKENKAHVRGECMRCGHCIAVCPTNAVSMNDYPMDEILEYSKEDFTISSDNLLNFIKFRRSIRHYKERPIEKKKIEKVLEAGRYTPTGANVQDTSYIVVQEKLEELKPLLWDSLYDLAQKSADNDSPLNQYAAKLVKMYNGYKSGKDDMMFFKAPVLIIVTEENLLNGGLAPANMELMANAEGLGMLFSGFIKRAIENCESAKKFLGIENRVILSCMLMGYPDISFKRTVPRKKPVITWK